MIGLCPLASLALTSAPAFASEGGLEIFPDERFFYLVALFAVLILPVNWMLVKPLLQVLDERRERIDGARQRSVETAKEADDVLARYEATVDAAKQDAENDRKALLSGSRRESSEASAAARAGAEVEVTAARAEVSAALRDARSQLRQKAEGLAREAATSVLGRPLS